MNISTETRDKIKGALEVLGVISNLTSTSRDNELHSKVSRAVETVLAVDKALEEREQPEPEPEPTVEPTDADQVINALEDARDLLGRLRKRIDPAANPEVGTDLDKVNGYIAGALVTVRKHA
jgi:hypothetical protein